MTASLVRLPWLDLVRTFVAVGRRMSFTNAAQDLCLTQPAISRQIHLLETRLGARLFVRGHRSITFTPAGRHLFDTADAVLWQLQQVVGRLQAEAPGNVGCLSPGPHNPSSPPC
jgi:LysR family transcriptional regulator, glycine cleavage system transcriptional activator